MTIRSDARDQDARRPGPRRVGRRRLAMVVASLALAGGLAACGDDGGAFDEPDVVIGPTSFNTLPPATQPQGAPDDSGPTGGEPVDGRVPGTQDYEVQRGDALFSIASAFDVEYEAICEVNNWDDCLEHQFGPGDVIRIPPNALPLEEVMSGSEDDDSDEEDAPEDEELEDELGGEGEDPDAPRCENGELQGTYEITAEDTTQTRVANRTDFSLEDLAAANEGNPAWNQFIPGQTIYLPCEEDLADADAE